MMSTTRRTTRRSSATRAFERTRISCITGLIPVIVLAGCGGGASNGDASGRPGISASSSLAIEVGETAKARLGLTGDPASPRGAARVLPDDDALVKLGQ